MRHTHATLQACNGIKVNALIEKQKEKVIVLLLRLILCFHALQMINEGPMTLSLIARRSLSFMPCRAKERLVTQSRLSLLLFQASFAAFTCVLLQCLSDIARRKFGGRNGSYHGTFPPRIDVSYRPSRNRYVTLITVAISVPLCIIALLPRWLCLAYYRTWNGERRFYLRLHLTLLNSPLPRSRQSVKRQLPQVHIMCILVGVLASREIFILIPSNGLYLGQSDSGN